MKVFVVGANGQIGKQIVSLLSKSDQHEVCAMVRSEEQASKYKDLGVEARVANLEGTVDRISEAMIGSDAVVFSAGSGGATGSDKTLLVDLDGAAKTIEAAEQAGVNRFIMVSAIQAHNRENWNESIKPYYVAKHYADKILVGSSLNYTIVRPGGLVNEPGRGKVTISENLERGYIPREDVANVIVAALGEEHTYRRSFDLTSGETSITEALKSF
ncbi:NAD(P)H-binding protein [Terrilactibacillus sp. BCM23-1]|uniref:NAD(P)H-binding protein n=1 Tax=Terrilactibacillus tamarindi TaxID=2599694 RepID=A0A6N8CNT9_9BACI|nr:SDR family oxidoreductase [Terrilactibacillus tamarindi]MTT31772.1 NAD(P)H-binding protein [Terrilactibacillus tamarindi]